MLILKLNSRPDYVISKTALLFENISNKRAVSYHNVASPMLSRDWSGSPPRFRFAPPGVTDNLAPTALRYRPFRVIRPRWPAIRDWSWGSISLTGTPGYASLHPGLPTTSRQRRSAIDLSRVIRPAVARYPGLVVGEHISDWGPRFRFAPPGVTDNLAPTALRYRPFPGDPAGGGPLSGIGRGGAYL